MAKGELRMIKMVIYRLKRGWGLPITIYHEVSNTYNLQTGAKATTRISKEVQRAILLPSLIHRTFIQDIGYLKANSNFTYGGQFTEGTRQLIIDRSDLPFDFEIKASDEYRIVFEHNWYNVKSVEEYDNGIAYFITIIKIEGEVKGEIYQKLVNQKLFILEAIA